MTTQAPAPDARIDNGLAQYRDQAGITQKDLAAILGVTQGMVSHIETGKRRISPDRASEWEKLIPVTRERMCFGKCEAEGAYEA